MNTNTETKRYRTRAKSGAAATLPNKMAIITDKKMQSALTLWNNGNAYMQKVSSMEYFSFKSGMLYFKGMPISAARLETLRTNEGLDCIDLPLLRILYSIILQNYESMRRQYVEGPNEALTLYVPDLAATMGKSRHISDKDIKSIKSKMMQYQTVVGIVNNNGNIGIWEAVLPVLIFKGYDEQSNTIRFTAPYLDYLIRMMYQISIKTDKKGNPILRKDNKPQLRPVHSRLIHRLLSSEYLPDYVRLANEYFCKSCTDLFLF